jgi:hypothetical protein
MGSENAFLSERAAALEQIISAAQSKADAFKPGLTVRIELASPTNAREAAEREVWELFVKGLQHLKNGGIEYAPGSITGALSIVSLRNTALAQTLGLKKPHFEAILLNVDYKNGQEAACAEIRRLADAAQSDAVKSLQLIQYRIFEADLSPAFGILAEMDQSMHDMAQNIAQSVGVELNLPRNNSLPDDKIDIIRRQMVMTMEMLDKACKKITKEMIFMADHPPQSNKRTRPNTDGNFKI